MNEQEMITVAMCAARQVLPEARALGESGEPRMFYVLDWRYIPIGTVRIDEDGKPDVLPITMPPQVLN